MVGGHGRSAARAGPLSAELECDLVCAASAALYNKPESDGQHEHANGRANN